MERTEPRMGEGRERPKEYAAAGEAWGGACLEETHRECQSYVLLQIPSAPAAEEGV